MYIKYGNKELDYLKARDPKLKVLIEKYGFIKRYLDNNLFESLVSSIIGQQISTKAANTVRERLLNKIKIINPKNINKLTVGEIQKLGISFRKATYLHNLSSFFKLNPNFDNYLKSLSNEDKIKELTKLDGVGVWTAEMLLIHYFNELDVFTIKDLAIKRGLMRLYDLDQLSREEALHFKNLYSPYGTIASIYLWANSK